MERLASYETGMLSEVAYSSAGSVSPTAGSVAPVQQPIVKQEVGGVATQMPVAAMHQQQQHQQAVMPSQQQQSAMAHPSVPHGYHTTVNMHAMSQHHVVQNAAQSMQHVPQHMMASYHQQHLQHPHHPHHHQHAQQPHVGNVYNAGASVPMNIPGVPMGAPMMQMPTGRGGVIKYCGVCGDIAKSYHFGGLSCDSCKAFFRRSVQNDNYLHFQCCHGGQCVISLTNRKSCQYCRMKRCFEIGMEKSWVMTEEERKALMKARAEKKLTKQLAAAAAMANVVASPPKTLQHSPSSSSLTKEDPSAIDYEPQVERMIDYLSPLEIKEIESIVTKYMHAYQHVPYRNELRYFDNDRPGFQVMEMFGTLIRRFAFYARMMADFTSLPSQDQRVLLKGGVLEMCLLRGALVFDPLNNRWPNTNMSLYKDTPVLKLGNISNLTSSRIFQMHMEFIGFIQQLGVDEPTIMLLILIVLFTERPGLLRPNWVEKYQAYYTSLLERYMGWRFGPMRAKHMFSKLLTKLSDLRELSDIHNQRNMRLGNDEISSIQQQLQHLKINPYPELKIVPEDNPVADQQAQQQQQQQQQQFMGQPGAAQLQYQQNSVSPTYPGAPGAQQAHYGQSSAANGSMYSPISSVSMVQQSSPYYSSPNEAGSPSFAHQQYNPTAHSSSPMYAKPGNPIPQQQQLDTMPACAQSAHGTPTTPLSAQQGPHGSPYDVGQHSAPSSSGYSSNDSDASGMSAGGFSNVDVQRSPDGSYGERTPPSMTDMGMQFMHAMQRSVSQVVNEPHFGYEWVKPDYHFDGLIDADDLVDALGSSPQLSADGQLAGSSLDNDADSTLSKSSRRSSGSDSDDASREQAPAPDEKDAAADASALSPRAMEELYYELEKYSELYCQ